MSIYTSPAMTTICSILSSKAIQRLLSSPVEEERSSSAGRRRLKRKAMGIRALGLTDLQISKEDVVVRHIGKDASILYEFKRPVNNMERS
jgi:hypothetical protein